LHGVELLQPDANFSPHTTLCIFLIGPKDGSHWRPSLDCMVCVVAAAADPQFSEFDMHRNSMLFVIGSFQQQLVGFDI